MKAEEINDEWRICRASWGLRYSRNVNNRPSEVFTVTSWIDVLLIDSRSYFLFTSKLFVLGRLYWLPILFMRINVSEWRRDKKNFWNFRNFITDSSSRPQFEEIRQSAVVKYLRPTPSCQFTIKGLFILGVLWWKI